VEKSSPSQSTPQRGRLSPPLVATLGLEMVSLREKPQDLEYKRIEWLILSVHRILLERDV
jgi:hypothetical protein